MAAVLSVGPNSSRNASGALPAGGAPSSADTAGARRARWLAGALLLIGLWGTLAPYAGPEVPVSSTVEVVDHVVPGILVLAIGAVALWRGAFELLSTSLVLLAGFWMTVTHVSLLAMGIRGQTPLDGAVWMFTPSAGTLLVAGLAFAMALASTR